MKRNLILAVLFAGALLVTSCKTTKRAKSDDDFYDFDKKETTTSRTSNTGGDSSSSSSSSSSQDGKYDMAEDGTYTKADGNVSSRFEEVEVVRGAVDYDAKYFIILGSFSQEANANKLVGRLSQQGFSPNILRSPSGMYRVSGYYFDDERAARMEVAEIRKKYPEYSDLWLLIKK